MSMLNPELAQIACDVIAEMREEGWLEDDILTQDRDTCKIGHKNTVTFYEEKVTKSDSRVRSMLYIYRDKINRRSSTEVDM